MKILGAITLVLWLAGCAEAPCWQQEEELRALLPGAEVSLAGIPAPVASEIVRAVRDAKEKWPAATQYIKSVKTDYAMTKKRSFPIDYYAYTNMAMLEPYNAIVLNDARLQSLASVRAQYKGDVWKGYHTEVPRNSEMYAIMTHELSHVLTANLRLQNDMELIRLYQKFQAETSGGVHFASNARLNILEFIAECVTDAACNGKMSQAISQAVMGVIEARGQKQ